MLIRHPLNANMDIKRVLRALNDYADKFPSQFSYRWTTSISLDCLLPAKARLGYYNLSAGSFMHLIIGKGMPLQRVANAYILNGWYTRYWTQREVNNRMVGCWHLLAPSLRTYGHSKRLTHSHESDHRVGKLSDQSVMIWILNPFFCISDGKHSLALFSC